MLIREKKMKKEEEKKPRRYHSEFVRVFHFQNAEFNFDLLDLFSTL